MYDFDLIIIGAGPGGYVTAIRAAQLGLKTAIIEVRDIGGTCLNRGCIPTKALLHAGEVFQEINESQKMGLHCESATFCQEEVNRYRDGVVLKLRTGTESLLKTNGVEVIRGYASFESKNQVLVKLNEGGEKIYSAKNIIIAAGSIVNNPQIPGIELAKTSDDILEGSLNIPQSVAVAGASVIGVEFAEMFRSFGKDVTIIATRDRLLPKTDKDLGIQLGQILKRKGIKILYHSRMKSIEKTETGIRVHFSTPDGVDSVEAEMLVSCIGRVPNCTGLALEKAGIKTNGLGVAVGSNFKTSVENIYAIGDCLGGEDQLAHVASAQGISVVEALVGHKKTINLKTVPACIYTSPEAANVGLTEEECLEKGIEIETGKFLMGANGKSLIVGKDRGFIKTIFDKKTGKILGAQLLCDRATDIVGELGVAIANGLKKQHIIKFMHPHPTIVEAVAESTDDADNLAIHLAKIKK